MFLILAISIFKFNRLSTVRLLLIGFLLCQKIHHVNGFDPSEFRVSDLEEVEPAFKEFDGKMFAGFLPIDEDYQNHMEEAKAEMSFWFFAPSEKKDTLTVWLNGGKN